MNRKFLFAFLPVLLALGCGRQDRADGASNDIRRLMERGQKLNASSPLTLAHVEGKLRKGMAASEFDALIAELDRLAAERNRNSNTRTLVMGGPFVEGDPPRVNPKRGTRTYLLHDANLVIVTEFAGPDGESDERVVSWRAEAVSGGSAR
jgi:hypothetical protein